MTFEAPASEIVSEMLHLLVSAPTPSAILAFELSAEAQQRLHYLVDAAEQARLTADERAELEEITRFNHVLRLLKVKAQEIVAQDAEWLMLPSGLDALERYTDEQLWAVARHGIPQAQLHRRQELLDQRAARPLTTAEQRELDDFIDQYDRYILYRSKALLILKQRGHDMEAFFRMEAHP